MINILSYTIGFALTIIASFFIGVFYFKYIIRKNAITNLHYVAIGEKLLVGITLLTASIAIIKTNGITTQSIILILLLLPRILLKKQNNIDTDQVKTKSNKLLLISIACFVFFFHYFGFYHLHDHVFYAKLGKAIYSNGNESWSALYDNFKAAKGIMLYHYSDMWLGEFISEIFFKNSLFCLTKIIYPTYHFIMFIICFGIINETAKNAKQAIFISLSIILGSALLFYPLLTPREGHHTFWHYGFPEVTSFKSLVVYPYLFLGLYYLKKNQTEAFLILISITCLEYFTLFIALFPTTNILIILFWVTKKQNLKNTIKYLFLFNLPLLLMLVLPMIFKDTVTSNSSFSNIKHVIQPINSYYLNWKFNIKLFFNYFLRPFYLYPITTILALFFFIKMKKLLVFTLLNLLISSLFIVIFYNLTNANQAISIIIGPLMTYLTIEAFKNLKNIVLPSIVISIFAILNLIAINSFNYGDNKLENFEKKLLNFSSIELNNKNWCYYSEYPWSTWMYSSQISNSPILLENDTYLGLEIAPFFNSSFETYKKNNSNSPICSINQNICDLSKLLKSLNIEYVYIENINTINKEFKLYLKPILIQNQKGIFKFNNNQFLNNPM